MPRRSQHEPNSHCVGERLPQLSWTGVQRARESRDFEEDRSTRWRSGTRVASDPASVTTSPKESPKPSESTRGKSTSRGNYSGRARARVAPTIRRRRRDDLTRRSCRPPDAGRGAGRSPSGSGSGYANVATASSGGLSRTTECNFCKAWRWRKFARRVLMLNRTIARFPYPISEELSRRDPGTWALWIAIFRLTSTLETRVRRQVRQRSSPRASYRCAGGVLPA